MPSLAAQTTHVFTNTKGESLAAEIVSADSTDVVIRRGDGKAFTLDLATLAPIDRAYVQQWRNRNHEKAVTAATTESDIAITVTMTPTNTANQAGQSQSFTPKVTLHNAEKTDFKGLKGTLVLVGTAANNPTHFKVLVVETFTDDLGQGAALDFTGKPAAIAGDYSYSGYYFVLQNSAQNIIQFQSSSPESKTAAEVLALQASDEFIAKNSRGRRGGGNNINNWQPMTSVLPLHLASQESGTGAAAATTDSESNRRSPPMRGASSSGSAKPDFSRPGR